MPTSTYIDRLKYPECIIKSKTKSGPIDSGCDHPAAARYGPASPNLPF